MKNIKVFVKSEDEISVKVEQYIPRKEEIYSVTINQYFKDVENNIYSQRLSFDLKNDGKVGNSKVSLPLLEKERYLETTNDFVEQMMKKRREGNINEVCNN